MCLILSSRAEMYGVAFSWEPDYVQHQGQGYAEDIADEQADEKGPRFVIDRGTAYFEHHQLNQPGDK